MHDVDKVVGGTFIFSVPLWTVAYTGKTDFRIAAIPTKSSEYGDAALGLFTDEDQANCWLELCSMEGERYRVVTIETPKDLEFWLTIAERLELTYVGFDYTQGIGTDGRGCSGTYETIAEVRRLARSIRPIQ